MAASALIQAQNAQVSTEAAMKGKTAEVKQARQEQNAAAAHDEDAEVRSHPYRVGVQVQFIAQKCN